MAIEVNTFFSTIICVFSRKNSEVSEEDLRLRFNPLFHNVKKWSDVR